MTSPLLQIRDLSIAFHTRAGTTYAVNDVSFELAAGETLGIVGESGSGKSVTCSSLLGLLPTPPAVIPAHSHAFFDGMDLLHLSDQEFAGIRGKRISMIFQDPMTCLNPCMCIGDQVAEPLVLHHGMSWKQARALAIEELARTGIPEPERRARAYPHEFSGGMRQRVMIAMAMITRPEILIADEPTTALDVTVQKQVLDLLSERRRELGTAVILITHDLGVVKAYADRIQVMYAGSIVESAPTQELLNAPLHAYTRSLMASIPSHQDKGKKLRTIPGLPPTLREPIHGCAFRPRNLIGRPELCLTDRIPELIEATPGHWVRNCPGCLATSGTRPVPTNMPQ